MKYNIKYDGLYITAEDPKTGEIVYEDEWIDVDFDTYASMANKMGMRFTEYIEWVIDENIKDAQEIEQEDELMFD